MRPEAAEEARLRLGIDLADRDEVREAARDDQGRRILEEILLPIVWQEIASSKALVVEMPLLFEAGLQARFREVWCAQCAPEELERRLASRPPSHRELARSQAPDAAKIAMSAVLIRTDQGPDSVFEVSRLLARRVSAVLSVDSAGPAGAGAQASANMPAVHRWPGRRRSAWQVEDA
jgi:dephospho-CoA kinase